MGHVNVSADTAGALDEAINRVRWALGQAFGA